MDAVRVAAGAVLLLTALAAPGCGRAKGEPAVPPAPPTAVARVGTLRVGLPSPRRGNLLFNCDASAKLHPAPRLGSASYAPDTLDLAGRRWLRAMSPAARVTYGMSAESDPEWSPDSAGLLAPDTLVVRAFVDATDEEIALERGELDVAVFWPGELSARMRSDERFRDPQLGLRERGVLACARTEADSLAPPRADMEMLNREAFAGDLLAWSEPAPDGVDGPPARYTVTPELPGATHLERILARIPSAGATRTLTLNYLDVPGGVFKTPVPDVNPGLRHLVSGYRPLFLVRCMVLAHPGARAAVRRIGADAFAELAPRAAAPDRWDSVRGLYR